MPCPHKGDKTLTAHIQHLVMPYPNFPVSIIKWNIEMTLCHKCKQKSKLKLNLIPIFNLIDVSK